MTNVELVPWRLRVERPGYRNNGKYQFVKAIMHFGAEACAHLTPEEVAAQCEEKAGPGTLVDDGTDLWWVLSTEPWTKCSQCGKETGYKYEVGPPSKEWLQRMMEAEDKYPSISVGGLACDLGLYVRPPEDDSKLEHKLMSTESDPIQEEFRLDWDGWELMGYCLMDGILFTISEGHVRGPYRCGDKPNTNARWIRVRTADGQRMWVDRPEQTLAEVLEQIRNEIKSKQELLARLEK